MSKCKNCGKSIKQIGPRKREYCNSTCRSNHWQKEARKKEKKSVKAGEIPAPPIYTSKENIKKLDAEFKKGFVPKTLKQLKEMVPAGLTGLDKSAWIAKKRTEYGI